MADYKGTAETAKLKKLLRDAERAKIEKIKDRFNLRPAEKGFLRGHAINIRQSEQPCDFGTLQILDFEISDTMKGPGVPVRMAGTYFSRKLWEGTVMDVPDPTPDIRPITPDVIYTAHDHDVDQIRAFYPGRGETPRRKTLIMGLLAMGIPAVLAFAIIVALHLFHVVQ